MTRACFAFIVILSLFFAGCEGTDVDMAVQAGVDAVRAVTLDDEGVHRLAVELASRSDREHVVAPPDNPHAKRLARLTAGQGEIDGYEFDFKVYLSPQVNAFAMADGAIRIHSGLMEILSQKGYDLQPAVSALTKLAALGGTHSVLSSHPAPANRAQRLQESDLTPAADEDSSLAGRLVNWVKNRFLRR